MKTYFVASLFLLLPATVLAAETGQRPEPEPASPRFGFSGLAAPMSIAGLPGGGGGVEARVGARLNRYVGLQLQAVGLFGAGGGDVRLADGTSATAASMLLVGGGGALAELTFGRWFVALGPEILGGSIGVLGARGLFWNDVTDRGAFFGVVSRAGVGFGANHNAFTLAIDVHTIMTPHDPAVIAGLAIGFDRL